MTRTFCARSSSISPAAAPSTRAAPAMQKPFAGKRAALALAQLITLAAAAAASASSADATRFAKLRVDSDPPGAEVVIVAELGKTPLTNEFINPGMYKIEIRHKSGYLPAVEELTLRDGQHAVVSHKLKKPQLFTKKRQIQLALGAGAAAGFAYAIVEQNERSAYRQKSIFTQAMSTAGNDEHAKKAAEYSDLSKDAGIKRTAAAAAAGILSAALQVTVFIW